MRVEREEISDATDNRHRCSRRDRISGDKLHDACAQSDDLDDDPEEYGASDRGLHIRHERPVVDNLHAGASSTDCRSNGPGGTSSTSCTQRVITTDCHTDGPGGRSSTSCTGTVLGMNCRTSGPGGGSSSTSCTERVATTDCRTNGPEGSSLTSCNEGPVATDCRIG